MMRKLILTVLLMSFMSVTAFVYAEDVYMTKNGKKYHKEVCRFTKNREVNSLAMDEAISKGLKPCGKCFGNTQIEGNAVNKTQGSLKTKVSPDK